LTSNVKESKDDSYLKRRKSDLLADNFEDLQRNDDVKATPFIEP
jgi:hypothetical protein